MSQSQEALKVDPVFEGVSVYRIALVRESTIAEPNTPIRKSSESAAILRPFFAGLDREQFVVLLVDAQHCPSLSPPCSASRFEQRCLVRRSQSVKPPR